MALSSPLANLFEKIITRIQAQVAAFRYINLDWNQLDFQQPPITYPALLIDFVDTAFAQMQFYQDGTAIVQLKLVYRSLTDTSNLTQAQYREAALEFFELEQDVYEALQAWYADNLLANAMIRTNAATEKRDDGLRVRVITFQCTFSDASVTT